MQYFGIDDIRRKFIDFFLGNDHRLVEPSGVLLKDDPTLLFVNSGMAPMKPYFLGTQHPPYPRLTNVQDCIRTIDIDDVGDSYHGSSFRMMGSWSFGDYFKDRAIDLAFELITEGFGFPAEQLFATVYGGDNSLPGVPPDDESVRVWEQYLPSERILQRPASDNFWGPAGDNGPCGPCTEVFYDRGEEHGLMDGSDPLVSGRHIEIWNAGVFMQYDMALDRSIVPLPVRCVDTGAGLERFAMLLQGVSSIHEVGQYASAFQTVSVVVKDSRKARIVFDHLKTSLLMMVEGVTPGNQRHAYVLRQLLRRALTATYLSGVKIESVLLLAWEVAESMDNRGALEEAKDLIDHYFLTEVSGFSKILGRAEKYLAKIAEAGELDAHMAFDLKATYGIPLELLSEFCRERAISFPLVELKALLEEHSAVSRG